MKDYKCGKCGTTFTMEQYHNLRTVTPKRRYERVEGRIVRKDDVDLDSFYLCRCGYIFGKQNWRLQNKMRIGDPPELEIKVSTIFTEANLGTDERPLWFETRIREVKCKYRKRHLTKKEAIDGHNELVILIKEGHYLITPQKEGPPLVSIIEKPVYDKAAAVRAEVEEP